MTSGGFRSRSKYSVAPSRQGGGRAGKQRSQESSGRGRAGRRPEGPRGSRGGSFSAGDATQSDKRTVTSVDPARAVAFEVLRAVVRDGAFGNLLLPRVLRERSLGGRDAAFATELTYGALRQWGVLDRVLDVVSSRPMDTLDVEVATALRLGAQQVLFMRVDDHAAVDTSVRLVEDYGQPQAKGFVNGVLRTLTWADIPQLMEDAAPRGELARLAFDHAHPQWIAESFLRSVGKQELAAALEADSQRPRVHLVARPGEISAEELALLTEGEVGRYSPYAVYLPGGDPAALEPVRQQLAAVQDEGSQLIARALVQAPLLGPDKGRWLDLCAGPGGKAALVGALADIDGASVDAVEIAEHRARLIEKTVADLPVRVHVADGRSSGLEPGFDRILVDAPCSGLGALRRRPEARWTKSEQDIAELTALQGQLLDAALGLLRPGGVVVYSTCSPDLRETRGIVDAALEAHPDVEELDAAGLIAPMENTGSFKSVQMWPHRHGTDAMFFAVLRSTVA